MKYVLIVIVSMVIAAACNSRSESTDTISSLGITIECKSSPMGAGFCKYTNRKGSSVCARSGDDGFTVPCEFYDGI